MSNKTSTFRTTEINRNELIKLYDSISNGAGKAVDAYLALRGRVLNGLKGLFTEAELTAIVDNFNGVMFDPKIAANKTVLKANLEDGVRFDGLDARHSIDAADLYDKIDKLTDPETFFLLEEVDRFWNLESAWGNSTSKLEVFLKEYC